MVLSAERIARTVTVAQSECECASSPFGGLRSMVWRSARCGERRFRRAACLPRTLPLRVLGLELVLPSDQAKIR